MFVRKKRNASGSISVQILEKIDRKNKLIQTVGSSKDSHEIEILYQEALKLIPQLTKQCQVQPKNVPICRAKMYHFVTPIY